MNYNVIVAGAGPVGLFLACELRLAKLDVLVLEPMKDPSSPLKKLPFGLRGLWGPSMEAFYRRGLLDAIAAQPEDDAKVQGPRPGQRQGPGGHFAGIQFASANVDSSRWPYRVVGPSDMQLGASMDHIERVLGERATKLGAEIRRGEGVTSFEATEDEVRVHGDRARFLVGCDGGRSTVRKLAGFDFVGTEPEFTGYSVEVELADPSVLPIGRHQTIAGSFTQWQPGVVGLVDFDGGAFHRAELTRDHVESVLQRVSGADVKVNALKVAATWTDRAKQVTSYRKERVLLAGDAAHVHSPLGGQGLNLGLGDAMNLGWKLAATIKSGAPDGLLDSYSAERHPIGASILDWTRAQVALMRPSAGSVALQAIMRDLMATQDAATYFAERLWGTTLRYDIGDGHPLIGRSCPDFELEDGTRIGALLRDGRGLLLDFDAQLGALDGVRHITKSAKDRLGLSAVLVRPDGFVAWASDGAPTGSEVESAAARWFAISSR